MAAAAAAASDAVLTHGTITPAAPGSSTRLKRHGSFQAMRTMAGVAAAAAAWS